VCKSKITRVNVVSFEMEMESKLLLVVAQDIYANFPISYEKEIRWLTSNLKTEL
jgi:hypothetical protein